MVVEAPGPAPAAPAGMQLDEPQAAAQAALAALPAGEEQPGEGAEPAGQAAANVSERAVRLELRGLIATVDWFGSAVGPRWALKPDEAHALEEAWLPYCLENGGAMPTWATALLTTAAIYAPRAVAAVLERRARGELASTSADAA